MYLSPVEDFVTCVWCGGGGGEGGFGGGGKRKKRAISLQ